MAVLLKLGGSLGALGLNSGSGKVCFTAQGCAHRKQQQKENNNNKKTNVKK